MIRKSRRRKSMKGGNKKKTPKQYNNLYKKMKRKRKSRRRKSMKGGDKQKTQSNTKQLVIKTIMDKFPDFKVFLRKMSNIKNVELKETIEYLESVKQTKLKEVLDEIPPSDYENANQSMEMIPKKNMLGGAGDQDDEYFSEHSDPAENYAEARRRLEAYAAAQEERNRDEAFAANMEERRRRHIVVMAVLFTNFVFQSWRLYSSVRDSWPLPGPSGWLDTLPPDL